MRNLVFSILFLSALVIPFQNCASTHDGTALPAVDYSSIEMATAAKAILTENCIGCHDVDAPDTNKMADILNLDNLVQSGYIIPGNPQESPLYLDIIDGIMPKDADPLSDSDVEILANWIRDVGESNADPTGGAIPELPADGGNTVPVTFIQVYANIIEPQCTGCHSAADSQGGVRLDSYANVMNYITAGNPGASQLYDSISNNRMPIAGPLLPIEKLSIFNWIAQGALDN